MFNSKEKYRFGDKIHIVRERRGATLKEVAAAAGVSESLISQIERNKVSPSVDTLLAIAEALDIDLEYLFKDHKKSKKLTVINSMNTNILSLDKVVYRHLASINEDKHTIETMEIDIEPGGEKGRLEYGHSGYEIGIILEGSGEIVYGTESYRLKKGDSISFSSDIPHILRNTGTEMLKALWIITPSRIFT